MQPVACNRNMNLHHIIIIVKKHRKTSVSYILYCTTWCSFTIIFMRNTCYVRMKVYIVDDVRSASSNISINDNSIIIYFLDVFTQKRRLMRVWCSYSNVIENWFYFILTLRQFSTLYLYRNLTFIQTIAIWITNTLQESSINVCWLCS